MREVDMGQNTDLAWFAAFVSSTRQGWKRTGGVSASLGEGEGEGVSDSR